MYRVSCMCLCTCEDFAQVHISGCAAFVTKDHSSDIKCIKWRPSHSIDRDWLISCDANNVLRLWAFHYKKLGSGVDVSTHAGVEGRERERVCVALCM